MKKSARGSSVSYDNSFLLAVATVLSRVFDPILLLAVTTLTAAIVGGLTGPILVQFAILYAAGMVMPPVLFLLWEIKNKRISNWDVSIRKERIVPLLFMVVFLALNVLVIFQFRNPVLNQLFILYFIWLIGFFCVTVVWKISGHTGIATLTVLLMLQWFGTGMVPLLLLLPLLAWARIYRKNHTPAQAVAGIIYSCVIVWLFASV